jgi:PIN domain nuclease of toxin-antitoxin system
MDYLLDTHTLIWAITDKGKLSPVVRRTLENSDNTIFVSSVVFWEIALKFSIGKLDLQGISSEEFPKLSLKMGFQLIPLSADESASYCKLIITPHKDLFDRMLIWQAIQRNLTFISKDDSIAQYGKAGLKILW